MSCISIMLIISLAMYPIVIVPVRGMSCISFTGSRASPQVESYRPREGYELHPLSSSFTIWERIERYRPREGYELHRTGSSSPSLIFWNVIVPVRGMSCILVFQIIGIICRGKFVIVPVRGMSCIGKSKQT